MNINYPEIGVCGLSCRLCPMYNTETENRCLGCKSPGRMAVGCPFLTCAVKKKGIEFCWECGENNTCEKWKKHREAGKSHDSFKCYQTLEKDISFICKKGVDEFEKVQKQRENLLKKMLKDFNEGRSKSYYCIAATILELEDLQEALVRAKEESEKSCKPSRDFKNDKSNKTDIKCKSKLLHSILDNITAEKKYLLKLRK